jgi:hypothetical protein
LNVGRYAHACSLIPSSGSTSKQSVIVAGGYWISSTEILNGNVWRFGPSLQYNIWKSTLLMHPKGGVILVAGVLDGEYSVSNIVFWLKHAGQDSQWSQLTKKLKTSKLYHAAFLVPAEISNCDT